MTARVERPDLEGIRDSFRAGFTDAYWLAKIHVVVAYALHLEQDAAGARERLLAMEWAHTDPSDYPRPEWDACYFCDMDRQAGHAPGCQMAALLAAVS